MILLCPLRCNSVWMLKMRMVGFFPAYPKTVPIPFNRAIFVLAIQIPHGIHNDFTLKKTIYSMNICWKCLNEIEQQTVSGLWIGCGVVWCGKRAAALVFRFEYHNVKSKTSTQFCDAVFPKNHIHGMRMNPVVQISM